MKKLNAVARSINKNIMPPLRVTVNKNKNTKLLTLLKYQIK